MGDEQSKEFNRMIDSIGNRIKFLRISFSLVFINFLNPLIFSSNLILLAFDILIE